MTVPAASQPTVIDEARLHRKVTWRIIPFVFLLYIVNYVDRANIGYASLQMNRELGLTSQIFGLAAGLFFIGYFIFEVPSNVILAKVGARIWIARILLTWGVFATLMGLVQNAPQLIIVRFLLGVAEAGFFPGVIVYLARWFRQRDLATAISLFTASIPVSYIIAAPLSTAIMQNVHWWGLSGWRWMFILEGIPAVLLGLVCFAVMTERPAVARWLTPEEREHLTSALEREQAEHPEAKHLSLWQTLRNPRVLYLAAIYFVYQVGSLGTGYWLPTIIKSFSKRLSTFQVGLIGMIPYAVATVAMILWSRHSDRTQERKRHAWIPLALAAVMMFVAAWARQPVLAMTAISLALAGLYAYKSPFWAIPGLFLNTAAAGTATAAINAIGNLGGFVGPYAQGVIVSQTGSPRSGLYFFGALLVIATIMMAAVPLRARTSRSDDVDLQAQEATA